MSEPEHSDRLRTIDIFSLMSSLSAASPTGVPNIMPDGRLCTPCDVSERYEVSVLDHSSLKAAVKASRGELGEYPCKRGYCFKAGIIERSRLFGLLLSGQSPDGD